MDQKKYIGMDVHQASISVAVRDAAGASCTTSRPGPARALLGAGGEQQEFRVGFAGA
jgi:hypothetical protein